MSITVVNLQDNRAVFRIFIALLRFSFDSPSYMLSLHSSMCRWLTAIISDPHQYLTPSEHYKLYHNLSRFNHDGCQPPKGVGVKRCRVYVFVCAICWFY
jgi:hypothetical protein